MAIMKSLLIIIGVIAPLVFASQNILFGNLAATLVPRTPNPRLVLAPLNINDPNQQWNVIGTAITSASPAYTNYVWDVSGASKANKTQVILYTKSASNPLNQQWTVSPTGVITSALAVNFTASANGTSNIIMTNVRPPAEATIQTAVSIPWYCQSVGDPHISPYPGGRNDIYVPGAQIPGTFTLSKTGLVGDADYLLIQADQQLCRPNVPGVYCNSRGIVKTQGHVILVKGDTVTIDGVVTAITGTLNVGNGVSVQKIANGNYIVKYPNGQTQFQQRNSGAFLYQDIFITANGGRQPTGGLCTPTTGPNVSAGRKRALTPTSFCLTWRAPNMTDDLFQYSSELAWRAANPLNFTSTETISTTNQTLLNTAYAVCAALNASSSLATQCSAYVNTAAIYDACLFDVTNAQDVSFAAAHTDACASKCSKIAASKNITIAIPTSGASSVAAGAGIASTITQSNSAISFTITAKDVNGNTVPTGGAFVVTISGGISSTQTYLGSGVTSVSYIPSTTGTLTISVTYQSTPIANSPFTVIVEGPPVTDPSQSTAQGPGVGANILTGTQVYFTVTARTSSGVARTTGGDAVTFVAAGATQQSAVVDNQNGNYTASYRQDISDSTFQLEIKINNIQIKGSPFSVYVIGE